VTNTVTTTSEDLGRPASGRLAARAEAITKVYGRGDAKVIALDEVTVGIPPCSGCWPTKGSTC
jgi:putative ABC transport system ATP-binding protein